jgi:hypothetical protein
MKTKLQIYRSAQQAAEDSLAAAKTKYDFDAFAKRRFDSEKLDPRDWDYWIQNFEQSRQMFVQLAAQKSFSPITTQPVQ